MTKETTSEQFFEAKYQQDPDPWDFATDVYEKWRYAATLNALGGRHFARVFEPGCSIGVLTEQLAHICDAVEAIEISATAADQAQQRCRELRNVNIKHASVIDGVPAGSFDLIVFSEIGYYFNFDQLTELAETLLSHLSPGGVFLAVHWLGHSADHLLTGDEVHQVLGSMTALESTLSQRHDKFRLDRWTKL